MKIPLLIVGLLISLSASGQEALEVYEPSYPESPYCRDESGVVVLNYDILENGSPHKIEIERSDSGRFARPAVNALAKYKFKPGTFNVAEKYRIEFNFKPNHKCGAGHNKQLNGDAAGGAR